MNVPGICNTLGIAGGITLSTADGFFVSQSLSLAVAAIESFGFSDPGSGLVHAQGSFQMLLRLEFHIGL
ncbi:hypothetical protein HJFPF1_07782 [Paramyrothecium foliicola]|nr:hypothetical protein HJFPF1_07782 [Paramyrothecium foliicola]